MSGLHDQLTWSLVLKSLLAASAVTIAIFAAAPAFADRAPTAEEKTRIEAALRTAGYKSWGKIELDDKKWEVDDAVDQSGKKFDLDLDPTTLAVVKKDPD